MACPTRHAYRSVAGLTMPQSLRIVINLYVNVTVFVNKNLEINLAFDQISGIINSLIGL